MGLFLACLFGGYIGLHKFIEKKPGLGLLYLFTCGLFGIGWIVDTIIYACKLFEKKPKPIIEPQPIKQPRPIIKTPIEKDTLLQPTPTEPSAPTKVNPIKCETHKVTGMSNYMDNIMSLAEYNDAYDLTKKELIDEGYIYERVYQYNFNTKEVELVPEPDNPVDPNAIKVVIDGAHVGYIKKGSCGRIRNLLNSNTIKNIDITMTGGKYKIILSEDDRYIMDTDDIPFFVHLDFYIKKEEEL